MANRNHFALVKDLRPNHVNDKPVVVPVKGIVQLFERDKCGPFDPANFKPLKSTDKNPPKYAVVEGDSLIRHAVYAVGASEEDLKSIERPLGSSMTGRGFRMPKRFSSGPSVQTLDDFKVIKSSISKKKKVFHHRKEEKDSKFYGKYLESADKTSHLVQEPEDDGEQKEKSVFQTRGKGKLKSKVKKQKKSVDGQELIEEKRKGNLMNKATCLYNEEETGELSKVQSIDQEFQEDHDNNSSTKVVIELDNCDHSDGNDFDMPTLSRYSQENNESSVISKNPDTELKLKQLSDANEILEESNRALKLLNEELKIKNKYLFDTLSELGKELKASSDKSIATAAQYSLNTDGVAVENYKDLSKKRIPDDEEYKGKKKQQRVQAE